MARTTTPARDRRSNRARLAPARGARVVLVTVPSLPIARKLAALTLERRCAACAQILTGLESHYWWTGKRARSKEVLVIFKTTRSSLPKLAAAVAGIHPYDTPQLISLAMESGLERYLAWLFRESRPARSRA